MTYFLQASIGAILWGVANLVSEEARKGLWTMKNAYQRRRVKARVEKRARMQKLDAITLQFAREVIEEETGAPLEIAVSSPDSRSASLAGASAEAGGTGSSTESKLIARDDRKNPLISTFEWTSEAAQRVLRVPAGFMRNRTQERIETLARDRGAASIDLTLVEAGIEIGKQEMAAMIANYPTPGQGAAASAPAPTGHSPSQAHKIVEAQSKNIAEAQSRAQVVPAVGSGYLNEVSSLTVHSKPGNDREH
jgi:hypothetical protein